MKVLVTDKISPEGMAVLKAAKGIDLVVKTGLSEEELGKEIATADGLIVRSGTQVDSKLLEKALRLKIIGRAGIGVDNVDVRSATKKGMVVVNTPGGNAVTAAEHTVAMLMALSRNIPQAAASMRQGQWEKNRFMGSELSGKTLGIVGFGNIGKIVCQRAQGLRLRVIVSDPFLTAEIAAKHEVELVSFDDLCKRADFITLHVPHNESTHDLINAETLAKMKDGVRIVNCARGGVIDEQALLQALDSQKVAGAALDVFAEEPPPKNHPLVKHDHVVCTPHLGASTAEAQLNVSVQVAEQVRDFLLSGEIRNAINVPSISAEMLKVLKPYLALGKRLGSFQGQICQQGKHKVQKLHIQYSGQVTDYDTDILTLTVIQAFLSPMMDAPVNFVNARELAVSRGIQLEESFLHQVQDFANQVTVTVQSEDESRLLSGAVFGKDNYRFVRYNDFYLEVIPDGDLLVTHSIDRPGVVGQVGSVLGEAKVNISRMQLALSKGTSGKAQEAVSFINIDQPAKPQVLRALEKIKNILFVYQVALD